MTAEEWDVGGDVDAMLRYLGAHLGTGLSPRKLRLLCVACCYRLDDLLNHPDAQRTVEVAKALGRRHMRTWRAEGGTARLRRG